MQRCFKLQRTFATGSKMQVLQPLQVMIMGVTIPVKPTPKIPRLVSTKQTLQVES